MEMIFSAGALTGSRPVTSPVVGMKVKRDVMDLRDDSPANQPPIDLIAPDTGRVGIYPYHAKVESGPAVWRFNLEGEGRISRKTPAVPRGQAPAPLDEA